MKNMEQEILNPHVFSYVVSPKLKKEGNDLVTPRDHMDFYFAEGVDNQYDNKNDAGLGYILLDTASEFLRNNYQSVFSADIRNMRLSVLDTYIDMLTDAGNEFIAPLLRREGYDLKEISKGLNVSNLSNAYLYSAKQAKKAATFLLDNLNRTKAPENNKRICIDFTIPIEYFASKLIDGKPHKIQKKLDMRNVFRAIRNAYDLYHRHTDRHSGEVLDPTVSDIHYVPRVVHPEVLQQRVELMGKELKLMFPER